MKVLEVPPRYWTWALRLVKKKKRLCRMHWSAGVEPAEGSVQQAAENRKTQRPFGQRERHCRLPIVSFDGVCEFANFCRWSVNRRGCVSHGRQFLCPTAINSGRVRWRRAFSSCSCIEGRNVAERLYGMSKMGGKSYMITEGALAWRFPYSVYDFALLGIDREVGRSRHFS